MSAGGKGHMAEMFALQKAEIQSKLDTLKTEMKDVDLGAVEELIQQIMDLKQIGEDFAVSVEQHGNELKEQLAHAWVHEQTLLRTTSSETDEFVVKFECLKTRNMYRLEYVRSVKQQQQILLGSYADAMAK